MCLSHGRDVHRALILFCIINSVDAGCSDTWKWDCNRAMAQLHRKEIQILTRGGGRWTEFQAIFTVHLLSRGCGAVTKNR